MNNQNESAIDYYTPKEASHIICPYTLSGRGLPDCNGDKCMLWRWELAIGSFAKALPPDTGIPMAYKTYPPAKRTGRGYCGGGK